MTRRTDVAPTLTMANPMLFVIYADAIDHVIMSAEKCLNVRFAVSVLHQSKILVGMDAKHQIGSQPIERVRRPLRLSYRIERSSPLKMLFAIDCAVAAMAVSRLTACVAFEARNPCTSRSRFPPA